MNLTLRSGKYTTGREILGGLRCDHRIEVISQLYKSVVGGLFGKKQWLADYIVGDVLIGKLIEFGLDEK